MKVAFFSAKSFDRLAFSEMCQRPDLAGLEISYFETSLGKATAVLADGYPIVCPFVCDELSAPVVEELYHRGVRLLALRSAGFNHVDLGACRKVGMRVTRVPAYSPHAVAEHAVCLLLALNRKIHRAYQRVKELNFSLDGLVGFDIHGKVVGVVGTGKIGAVFTRIMSGFGAHVLAFDPHPSNEVRAILGVTYVTLDELIERADIISLHCPLTPDTHHIIDSNRLSRMRSGVIIINTSRGGLVDSQALVNSLKSGKIGGAGLDVYEEEEGIFFFDLSASVLHDDTLARLLTFPNVIITAHQAFLTREALRNIAETTLRSMHQFASGVIDDEACLV
jgi:D-lactate dehydrogenase